MADFSVTDTTRLTFAMSPTVQTLATVAVSERALTTSASLSAFERRRLNHAGSARFITRGEIARRHPVRITDVLQSIPSISLMIDYGAATRTIPMSRRGVGAGSAWWPYQIGVDGHLLEADFDMNSVDPSVVYGVEVFPGPATIPMEYRSLRRSSGCGLIMIWTRRGP